MKIGWKTERTEELGVKNCFWSGDKRCRAQPSLSRPIQHGIPRYVTPSLRLLISHLLAVIAPLVYAFDQSEGLISAVLEQDLERVREQLDQGADPTGAIPASFCGDVLAEEAETLLRFSIENKCPAIALLLLEAGAASRGDELDLGYCLWQASLFGYLAVVKRLVQDGVNADAVSTPSRGTAIHAAAREGHKTVLSFLVSKGAQVNRRTARGWTPLMICELLKREDCTAYLKSTGAQMDANDTQRVRLHCALLQGDSGVLADLLQNVNVYEERDYDNVSLAARCISGSDIEILKLLLKSGIKIQEPVDFGTNTRSYPILVLATTNPNKRVFRYLLELGAPINVSDPEGLTPLHFAIFQDREDDALLLIERGADVFSETKLGVTPLMLAAMHGLDAVVDACQLRGADPKRKSLCDLDAIDYALAQGHHVIAWKLAWRATDP